VILELDAGNSQIKWRILTMPQDAGIEVAAHGKSATLNELQSSLPLDLVISLARACSVRADSTLLEFAGWVRQSWDIELRIARVSSSCGGVTNSYADVSRMGIDRWLAMVAAFGQARGACIVVDAGTALTVDLVNADGDHRGGYILPGLNMMADALEQNTGIRLRDRRFSGRITPGTSTEQAVLQGALASAIALIGDSVASLSSSGARVSVYISGGGAGLIAEAMASSGEFDLNIAPELVLDGLAIACPA
jgi:type III pantothenate kinase